jgi:hypothetical protein
MDNRVQCWHNRLNEGHAVIVNNYSLFNQLMPRQPSTSFWMSRIIWSWCPKISHFQLYEAQINLQALAIFSSAHPRDGCSIRVHEAVFWKKPNRSFVRGCSLPLGYSLGCDHWSGAPPPLLKSPIEILVKAMPRGTARQTHLDADASP